MPFAGHAPGRLRRGRERSADPDLERFAGPRGSIAVRFVEERRPGFIRQQFRNALVDLSGARGQNQAIPGAGPDNVEQPQILALRLGAGPAIGRMPGKPLVKRRFRCGTVWIRPVTDPALRQRLADVEAGRIADDLDTQCAVIRKSVEFMDDRNGPLPPLGAVPCADSYGILAGHRRAFIQAAGLELIEIGHQSCRRTAGPFRGTSGHVSDGMRAQRIEVVQPHVRVAPAQTNVANANCLKNKIQRNNSPGSRVCFARRPDARDRGMRLERRNARLVQDGIEPFVACIGVINDPDQFRRRQRIAHIDPQPERGKSQPAFGCLQKPRLRQLRGYSQGRQSRRHIGADLVAVAQDSHIARPNRANLA